MALAAESSTLEVATLRRGGFDPWLLAATLALVGLGLIMVYSASISQSFTAGYTYFLQKEAAFIALGVVAMAAGARLHYSVWKRLSTPIAGASVLLLVAVLVPHLGTTANGAQRWFQFHGYQLEPSELAKVALAIYFAHWLSRKGATRIRQWGACTVPFGVMLGLVCILVLLQPDMGTAIVIGLAMIAVYFVAGARLDHLASGIAIGFALGALGVRLQSYRGTRFAVWLDPWKYAGTAGYHTVQALIALGRGGLFGVGPGNSQQKYLLPAPFTDSIFAVTAEELGFLGAVAIIGLFVLLAYRGYKIAREAPDGFAKLLAVGITSTIVLQAFLNIAAITDSVPFTGVPLPFISYGGSSLVVCMFSVGILLNISWQSTRQNRGYQAGSKSEGSSIDANSNNGGKDRRPRVPGTGGRRITAPALVRTQLVEERGHGTRARQGHPPGFNPGRVG